MPRIARTPFRRTLSRSALPLAGTLALTMAALAPAVAQPPQAPVSQITITGNGSVSVAPDMAVVTTRVVTAADTAPGALSENSAAVAAVISDIKDAGIEAKDIQTSGFSIYPRYDRSDNQANTPPKIVGYEVSNGVRVNIRDLEKLGGILTSVVDSGANQIGGIQFEVSDPEVKLNEARKAAVADARERAELYAAAAGVELGQVLNISETGAVMPRPAGMRMEKMMMAADAAPIEAGENTLTASVTITWSLAGQ